MSGFLINEEPEGSHVFANCATVRLRQNGMPDKGNDKQMSLKEQHQCRCMKEVTEVQQLTEIKINAIFVK